MLTHCDRGNSSSLAWVRGAQVVEGQNLSAIRPKHGSQPHSGNLRVSHHRPAGKQRKKEQRVSSNLHRKKVGFRRRWASAKFAIDAYTGDKIYGFPR
jgi:hypothetical protein